MRGNTEEKTLRQRLSAGKLTRADVVRRLGELAFGRANDCVRLVLEDSPDLSALDLSLLSEVKRNDKGTVEVKLIDRIRALERLLEAGGDGEEADAFFAAAAGDGECL